MPQLQPSLGVRLNALKKNRTAMQKIVPRWEYKVEALHGAQAEQCERDRILESQPWRDPLQVCYCSVGPFFAPPVIHDGPRITQTRPLTVSNTSRCPILETTPLNG